MPSKGIILLLLLTVACSAHVTPKTTITVSSAIQPTTTVYTVTTVKPLPTILFSGHVFLEANTDRTVNPSSYLFDFDTNRFSSEDSKANDISFGLTNGSSLFLVIKPIYGAMGIENDKGTQNNNTSFQDCLDVLPNYSKGGMPIPEKGSHYCWKTNQGRIVGFSVEKISENSGLYEIDLNYIVWEIRMN